MDGPGLVIRRWGHDGGGAYNAYEEVQIWRYGPRHVVRHVTSGRRQPDVARPTEAQALWEAHKLLTADGRRLEDWRELPASVSPPVQYGQRPGKVAPRRR